MKIKCPNCQNQYDSDYGICPFCGAEGAGPEQRKISLEGSPLLKDTVLDQRYQIKEVVREDNFSILYRGVDLKGWAGQEIMIREYYPHDYCDRNEDGSRINIKNAAYYDMYQRGLDIFLQDAGQQLRVPVSGFVQIKDVFSQNQTGYLVMEYPQGVSLQECLKGGKQMTMEEAVSVMLPVMDSLDQLHQEGMLHLNVNPDSILLLSGGEVKLMDVARYTLPAYNEKKAHRSAVMEEYVSPDLKRRNPKPTEAADVYSVCAVLCRLLTGSSPEAGIASLKQGSFFVSSGRKKTPDDTNKISIIINGILPDEKHTVLDMYTLMQQFTSVRPVDRIKNPDDSYFHGKDASFGSPSLKETDIMNPAARKGQAGPGRIAAVVGCVMLAVVVAAGVLFTLSKVRNNKKTPAAREEKTVANSELTVPLITGQTFDKARSLLEEQGLKLNRKDARFAEDGQDLDQILYQSPGEGESSNASNTVDVIVTASPITLSDVLFDNSEKNKPETLEGYKLTKETEKNLKKSFNLEVSEEESNYIKGYMLRPENYVDYDLGEEPVKSSKIDLDTEIPQYCRLKLITSGGRKNLKKGNTIRDMKYDDLTGNSVEDVLKKAKKLGFYIGISSVTKYSSATVAKKGQVASIKRTKNKKQSQTLKTGDELLLVLSRGPEGIYRTVAEMRREINNTSYSEVRKKLTDNDVQVSSTYIWSNEPKGSITDIEFNCQHASEDLDSESRGYILHQDDEVTFVFSKGKKPKPAPSKPSGGGSSKRKKNTTTKKPDTWGN